MRRRSIRDLAPLAFPAVGLLVTVVLAVVVFSTQQGSPAPGPGSSARIVPAPTPTATESGASSPGASPRATPSQRRPAKPRRTCVDTSTTTLLTAVTLNIHSGRDAAGALRIESAAAALETWDADLVLLQEVDRGRAWTRRIDMPALLAERLGFHWVFGNNVGRSATNQYGTAILSRYPISSSTNRALPRPGGTQQRGLLHAVVDVEGVEVSVYDTHLEHTSQAARAQQIGAITPVLAADPRPRIFGGDLNAGPSSPVVASVRRVLTDTWSVAGTGPGPTVPARSPRARIDYLFHGDGREARLRPVQAAVLSSGFSDHLAVWARYQLTTSGTDVCVPVLDDSAIPGPPGA